MTKDKDINLTDELASALAEQYPAKTAPLFPPPPSSERPSIFKTNTPRETVRERPEGYDELHRILAMAFKQAATGKGKERHAYDAVGFRPWEHQPILVNARQVGPGGLAQQVMKKAGESVGMANRKEYAAARAEALGAIVYAAALFKLYEEIDHGGQVTSPS